MKVLVGGTDGIVSKSCTLQEDSLLIKAKRERIVFVSTFPLPYLALDQCLSVGEPSQKPAEKLSPERADREEGEEWICEHTAKDLHMGLQIIPRLLAHL